MSALADIVDDAALGYEECALKCLEWVGRGDGDDPRVAGYIGAAQTFALLAIARQIRKGVRG